jgi:hypothetical protein
MSYTRTVIEEPTVASSTYGGLTHIRNWSTPTELAIASGGSWQSEYSIKGFSDVEIPNFHTRRKQGEIFNNPFYKFERKTITSTSGSWNLFFTGWSPRPTWYSRVTGATSLPAYVPWEANDVVPSHHSDTLDLADELKNKAVAKAWARVHDESAAILASIAEGKDTIQFVGNVLFRVIKILRALRRLDLKQVRDEITPMEYSKLYMEYRYALRPLAGEVEGVLEAMNRVYSSNRLTRGWREIGALPSDPAITTGEDSSIPSIRYMYYRDEVVTSTRVNVGCGILFDVQSTGANSWGLDQVVQTGWEVIPFSFVIDWFCNIADIISAHSPKLNTNVLANWDTVEITTSIMRTRTFSGQNTVQFGSFLSMSGLCQEFVTPTFSQLTVLMEKWRSPDPVIPWLPQLDINLDVLKLLDLAIILKGFRSSIR